MTKSPTDHRPAATPRPSREAAEERANPPSGGPSRSRPGHDTTNPVRIGRIGADHIQVSIRPALDDAELVAVVDRLERLLDAGYDTIRVVFEGSDRGDTPMAEVVAATVRSR